MATIFNKRRKQAEYELKLAKNEVIQTMKLLTELQYKYDCLEAENNTHYIKNLPKSPRRVEIEFHIGARKVVMFDGDNFIKPNGQVYRLASIKCWREI